MQIERYGGDVAKIDLSDACPITTQKGDYQFVRMARGMILYINGTPPGKIGERFGNYPASIFGIEYAPRPWWAFWRRRKPVGYYVQWE